MVAGYQGVTQDRLKILASTFGHEINDNPDISLSDFKFTGDETGRNPTQVEFVISSIDNSKRPDTDAYKGALVKKFEEVGLSAQVDVHAKGKLRVTLTDNNNEIGTSIYRAESEIIERFAEMKAKTLGFKAAQLAHRAISEVEKILPQSYFGDHPELMAKILTSIYDGVKDELEYFRKAYKIPTDRTRARHERAAGSHADRAIASKGDGERQVG